MEPAWTELLARLETESWRTLFVLGGSDTGKTTLCRALGAELARRHATFVVDCDPGQSALGPPTALALGREPWGGEAALALRFVGSTSPSGHYLQTLVAAKRLHDRAVELGAARILFDSPGYFESGGGREFAFQMLDLLQPEHVVALQRASELEPVLAIFARRARPAVHRLASSAAVVPRDSVQRRARREERLRAYLAPAVLQELAFGEIGLHGMVPRLHEPIETLTGRVVAACDARGEALALGLLERLDLGRRVAHLFAPPFDPGAVASLQFGSQRFDRTGRQL